MSSLRDILLQDDNRSLVITDCVELVDQEVASKSGLSGVAVKGAYGLVKKVKPGIIREAVNRLIDDFVDELDPYYRSFSENGAGTFSSYLEQRRAEVASSLLNVTDRRIDGAKNKTIKKAYQKLRPTGQKHVEQAVPGVGRVVEKHATGD